MKSIIRELVEAAGPSGYEGQVRSVVQAYLKTLVDEYWTDNLGNLIARKGKRTPDGLKLMLAAHMDEIGLIVTHIDEKGFVRFAPVGGLRRLTSLGGRVRFLNGTRGVIGSERLPNENTPPTFEQMYIDLGITHKSAAQVQVGDLAVFEGGLMEMGNRLIGKALDDRVGVALLIEVLKRFAEKGTTSPHELYFVFSAQEEVGSRGAAVAAYGIDPDLGINIDVTASAGTPKGLKMAVELGQGPALKVRDQYMLADRRVLDWMVAAAQQAGLPYQLEILEQGYTDGYVIQLNRAGVLVGGISIPARYIHTPSEMVDFSDIQNAAHLLWELVSNPVKFVQ